MKHTCIILCCVCLLAFAGLNGCGKPNNRSDVSGMITLNGEPLSGGLISFIAETPDPDASVSGVDAEISEGKYSVTGELGLLPGKYLVKIRAQRRIDKKTGKDVTNEDNKENVGSYTIVNLVPEDYNENSTTYFTVEKKGITTFDLDIKTK